MMLEVLTNAFFLLFITGISLFVVWVGARADNDTVYLLGVLGLIISWWSSRQIKQDAERLLKELMDMDDDDEDSPEQ